MSVGATFGQVVKTHRREMGLIFRSRLQSLILCGTLAVVLTANSVNLITNGASLKHFLTIMRKFMRVSRHIWAKLFSKTTKYGTSTKG